MPRFLRPAWATLAIAASSAVVVPLAVQAAQPSIDRPAATRALVGAQRLDPPDPAPAGTLSPTEKRILDLVNAERGRRGLAPVRYDSRLADAARRHSLDQAGRRQISHVGSDGSSAGDRVLRAGYVWRSWAENVASGQPSPEAVMAAWMSSPGHRTNILSTMGDMGIGVAVGSDGRPYWTQVFAAPG